MMSDLEPNKKPKKFRAIRMVVETPLPYMMDLRQLEGFITFITGLQKAYMQPGQKVIDIIPVTEDGKVAEIQK